MAKVGRPKKFTESEELQNKIEEYFNTITFTYPLYDEISDGKDENGKEKFKKVPRLNNAGNQVYYTQYYEIPTVIGLCRFLGIHRDTLCEYEKKPEFSDTIKKAKQRIEQYLEEQLFRRDQVTGIIFNLKNNFGWKDKQEVDQTTTMSFEIKDPFAKE